MIKKDDSNRKYSAILVDGIQKAPARSMLRAVDFTDEDFKRPQVGIASTWSQVTPCNIHINGLADEVAKGVYLAYAKPIIFNTITIDANNNEINLKISEADIQKRLSTWQAPEPNVKRGVLAKYAKTVGSASEGVITDKF